MRSNQEFNVQLATLEDTEAIIRINRKYLLLMDSQKDICKKDWVEAWVLNHAYYIIRSRHELCGAMLLENFYYSDGIAYYVHRSCIPIVVTVNGVEVLLHPNPKRTGPTKKNKDINRWSDKEITNLRYDRLLYDVDDTIFFGLPDPGFEPLADPSLSAEKQEIIDLVVHNHENPLT